MPEVSQGTLMLANGDILLLATDGIATLSELDILRSCSRVTDDASTIAGNLVASIDETRKEGQDNATVLVVRQPDYEEATRCIRKTGTYES